jgi:hypothetical protein
MATFSAEWLALREPADHGARAEHLIAPAVAALGSSSPDVKVIDLAAGAGSNLRYLAPRLPFSQQWTLVDRDRKLLEIAARGAHALQQATVTVVQADLSQMEDVLSAGATDSAAVDTPASSTLVTASALLDLVSEAWLARLASRCRAAQAVALFALTYNGRIVCQPADPLDELVRALVNRHQRRDKGFGPAAGPYAAHAATVAFEQEGYRVQRALSNWELGPGASALQQPLVDGWAGAAIDESPGEAGAIAAWQSRRTSAILKGAFHVNVGHEDLLAVP